MSTSILKKYNFSTCTKQQLEILHNAITNLRYKKLDEEERNNFRALQGKCFSIKHNLNLSRYKSVSKAVLEFGELHVINGKEIMSVNGIVIKKRHSPNRMNRIYYGIEKLIVHGFIIYKETTQNATTSAMVHACMDSAIIGKNIIPHSRYLQLLKKYDNEVGVEI